MTMNDAIFPNAERHGPRLRRTRVSIWRHIVTSLGEDDDIFRVSHLGALHASPPIEAFYAETHLKGR